MAEGRRQVAELKRLVTGIRRSLIDRTADPDIASMRFNPDTSVDYPFETGAGEEVPTAPSDGGGACG